MLSLAALFLHDDDVTVLNENESNFLCLYSELLKPVLPCFVDTHPSLQCKQQGISALQEMHHPLSLSLTTYLVCLFNSWIDICHSHAPSCMHICRPSGLHKVFAIPKKRKARFRKNKINCFVFLNLLQCVTSCWNTSVIATCHRITGISRHDPPPP